jgi:hypothetical protein
MNPKLLSWNVRVLKEGDERLRVCNYSKSGRRMLFVFRKLDWNMSSSLGRSLWGYQYVDWYCLNSRGTSSGILLMWDRKVVEKVEQCVGMFVVACSFRNVDDHFKWAFFL